MRLLKRLGLPDNLDLTSSSRAGSHAGPRGTPWLGPALAGLGFAGPRPGDGDKTPFRADGPGPGVLCLHGFSGTPFEVRPLAEGLARRGYTVRAPLLAGHGDTAEALAATRWTDWLTSAATALDELRAATGGRPVAVAGFSMGGLLALRLARQHPSGVASLAVMAAALRLRTLEATVVRAISRLPAFLRRGPLQALPKRRGFDVTDPEMRRRNPSLPVLPLAGVASLLDLGALVRQDLPSITAPILVAHGSLDRTVPLEDSLELVGCIGSERVERLWLPRSGHLLAIDVERATLIEAVGRFFDETLGHPRKTPPRAAEEASS